MTIYDPKYFLIPRRPLYEGVDWNPDRNGLCVVFWVALFTRAWIEIHIRAVKAFYNFVALFTRAWIEIPKEIKAVRNKLVALFTRAWIEISALSLFITYLSGRPLYEGVDWNYKQNREQTFAKVALFTRAWIEIIPLPRSISEKGSPSLRGRGLKYTPSAGADRQVQVALFTRAWIEIDLLFVDRFGNPVALFTRAWIEILRVILYLRYYFSRPLYEGVDWNFTFWNNESTSDVALFTRAWIEIKLKQAQLLLKWSRPLYEGVDWNVGYIDLLAPVSCRPLYEGVDWNKGI